MKDEYTVDEIEVELCLELARQFDEEDLTHPPHRREEEEEAEKDG